MSKILHTADWHVRDRQYGRPFRGKDREDMVHEVLDIAIREKVDCIINGGDVFQVNRPSEKMQKVLFDVHHRLLGADIPMYTVTGNHDASEPSFLSFPGYGRRAEHAGVVCIDHQVIVTRKGVAIAGFPASATIDDIRAGLKDVTAHIAVWHGAIQDMVPFEMQQAISLADLPPGPKAWLLGDIHLRQRRRLDDGTLVSYPGTVDLQDRGEGAEKFVDIYELADDFQNHPFPEPVEIRLNTRPVVYLSVADDAEADQAVDKVVRTVREAGRGVLVFLRYARPCRAVVNRIHAALPPADSVFLYAPFHKQYTSAVARDTGPDARPTLEGVVAELVTEPGARDLATKLASRDADVRQLLAEWTSEKLQTYA